MMKDRLLDALVRLLHIPGIVRFITREGWRDRTVRRRKLRAKGMLHEKAGRFPAWVERIDERIKFHDLRSRARRKSGATVSDELVTKVKAHKKALKRSGGVYNHNPRLAVIITSFNQRWNIPSMAERLLRNRNVSEIIVCEDGSIDGSLELWLSLLSGRNHFVIRSNDLHEIRTLDRALRLTRSDVCCVIQDDDIVPENPGWSDEALALFDRHERLGVVGGFMAYPEPPKPSASDAEPDLSFVKKRHRGTSDFQFVASVCIGPYYVRSSCYADCGGFDTSYSEPGQAGVGFDEEFAFRAWLHGWQVGYLHQPFKTGEPGKYNWGAGGSFLYGEPSERLSHDIDNKRKIAVTYGPHYDRIVRAVTDSNAALSTEQVGHYSRP
jgi:glycosyltransferase involved in cell wall biosynthesis